MSSTVDNGKNETPGPAPKSPAPQRAEGVAYDELHCPLCGGLLRRRWGSVCVGTFVAFFLTALLAFVGPAMGLAAQSWGDPRLVGLCLGLWSRPLAIVFLIAIPVTGALAVASRSRCRLCGHRLWPSRGADGARRSVWLGLAGCAVFLVSLGILTLALTAPREDGSDVTPAELGRTILGGLAIVFLIAIPITGALAAASQSRCRLPGDRFLPRGGADDTRFPVHLGVAGCAILLVSLAIGTKLVLTAPGEGVSHVALMKLERPILAGLTLVSAYSSKPFFGVGCGPG